MTIHKKAAGKTLARPRLSLAARLLGGSVRAALPAPAKDEPWRNKKLTIKNGFNR